MYTFPNYKKKQNNYKYPTPQADEYALLLQFWTLTWKFKSMKSEINGVCLLIKSLIDYTEKSFLNSNKVVSDVMAMYTVNGIQKYMLS